MSDEVRAPVTVTLRFGESSNTNFKFIDCVAEIPEEGKAGVIGDKGKWLDPRGAADTCDYLAGLIYAQYEVKRRGRHFWFGPKMVLEAVDRAIDEVEYPPEYII